MPQEHDDSISEVLKLFLHCLYDLQRTATQDWQSLDLTMAQLKILFTLSFEGPVTISKLAEALGVSQPTASQLVERVVQAGLAERVEHATDRRSTLARLTERGETMVRRLQQGRLDRLQSWLIQLDKQDIAALRQGLEALMRVIPSALTL